MDINKVMTITQNGESWQTIPDFPNYLISNMGRLYSGRFNRVIQGELTPKGYKLYELYSDKHPKGKKFRACRLVAAAFCKDYSEDKEIHHCNLCRSDDRADNLMCVTPNEHDAIHKAIKRFINANVINSDESEVAAA